MALLCHVAAGVGSHTMPAPAGGASLKDAL